MMKNISELNIVRIGSDITYSSLKKIGYHGYIKAIVDGRGKRFCDECVNFLRSIYGHRNFSEQILKDALASPTC